MPKALLDTTAYVDMQRARRHLDAPWAVNTLRNLELHVRTVGRPCLSMLTIAEIARGIEHELSQERLEAFRNQVASNYELIPLDFEAACLTGQLYTALERGGRRIGVFDTCLAAISVTRGLTLVTANMKHFHRVTEAGYPLRLENWRE